MNGMWRGAGVLIGEQAGRRIFEVLSAISPTLSADSQDDAVQSWCGAIEASIIDPACPDCTSRPAVAAIACTVQLCVSDCCNGFLHLCATMPAVTCMCAVIQLQDCNCSL